METLEWSGGEVCFTGLEGRYGISGASLVFVPRLGRAMVVDAGTLEQLRVSAPETAPIREMLLAPEHAGGAMQPEKRMEFLPTLACNFRCSYCYAAKAHDQRKLTPLQYDAALEHLMLAEDAPDTVYKISFVGGGEPLLEWGNILRCMEKATRKADAMGRQARFSIITNGSLCRPEMCDGLKKYNVGVRVSFEILPDIQQQQRGSYDKVARNMTELCHNGVRVGIRSIITSANVQRQTEMVREAAEKFPMVKSLDFEPVCTDELDATGMAEFYSAFTRGFLQAYEVARELGIRLDCIALRMARGRGEYYCPGDFCISPSGAITACHRSIQPQDCGGETFIYGSMAADGSISTDVAAVERLARLRRAENHPECQGCFARWNCAGGCLYQRFLLTEEQFRAQCDFTRSFLLDYLVWSQDKAYRERYGLSLQEVFCKSGERPASNPDKQPAP